MKKTNTKYYCDFCGKELTSKNAIASPITAKINLLLSIIYILSIGIQNYNFELEDCCGDCYKSFKKWLKYRKSTKK